MKSKIGVDAERLTRGGDRVAGAFSAQWKEERGLSPITRPASLPGRLTISAARTSLALFIHRAVRPIPPDHTG